MTVTQPDAVDETVLEVEQQITGVSAAQAENPAFTAAFTETVAASLDVFPSDVLITAVEPVGTDAVSVSYTVQNVEETKLEAAEATVESAATSQAVGAALLEAGFDDVHVEHAEAQASEVRFLAPFFGHFFPCVCAGVNTFFHFWLSRSCFFRCKSSRFRWSRRRRTSRA